MLSEGSVLKGGCEGGMEVRECMKAMFCVPQSVWSVRTRKSVYQDVWSENKGIHLGSV